MFGYRTYVVVSGVDVFVGLHVNMCIVNSNARFTAYGNSSLQWCHNSVIKYTDISSDNNSPLNLKCVLHRKV
jgi:hypothetical protein